MKACYVADYWRQTEGGVRCELCPHGCVLKEGARGRCLARMCREGRLVATGYGVVSSIHVDPIEKKPLYHFLPGAHVLSVGGWGCNLRCAWCQNWQIAQESPPYTGGEELLPAELCTLAQEAGSPAVAHTYNEPLINFEYVRDSARLCRAAGIGSLLVTNGYICAEPLRALLPDVQAVNLDLKSLSDTFYRTWCQGRLAPVQQTALLCREAGVHLELTCLLIPGENTDPEQVGALAEWIAAELGREVPLHLSAYYPCHKMTRPPTGEQELREAFDVAEPLLDYVYLGNTRLVMGRDTHCPGCGHVLVERLGYQAAVVGVTEGACTTCARPVDLFLG